MITLNDYDLDSNFNEFDNVEQLEKAMSAGHITGRETTNLPLGQEPLKVESLEKTLKLLEYRQKDIKLFNAMPKMVAYNTVEEFLQLQSYGSQRGGFYNEGELSETEDSVYVRRSEKIKYMQVTGEVTLQAQLVSSYFDALRKETENKMMWITRLADMALTKADESFVPQEFNSIYKQHASIGSGPGDLYPSMEQYYRSGTVIDMRGKSLSQSAMEDAAVRIDMNYGSVDSLFAPTSVLSNLSKSYYEQTRIMQGGTTFVGGVGVTPKSIGTTIGDVNLQGDKFMAADKFRFLTDPSTTSKAPSGPTAGTAPATVVDGASKYAAAPEIGNVYYAVSAINRYGESNLTLLASSALTLVAGRGVDLTFTAGGGAYAPSGYVIYRTKVTTAGTSAGLQFYPLFKVSQPQVTAGAYGAAAGSVRDLGYFMPDTEQGFMTEMIDEVLSFKQLAPISKLDLAIMAPSKRFLVYLFGTPQVYAPKKIVRFINIGQAFNPYV